MRMPKNKRTNRSPQTPKPRNLACRDMMLFAASRGQEPTDKAASAYKRNPKHRGRFYSDED